jgi:hypothetical protein
MSEPTFLDDFALDFSRPSRYTARPAQLQFEETRHDLKSERPAIEAPGAVECFECYLGRTCKDFGKGCNQLQMFK